MTCSQTSRSQGERGENPGAGEVKPYLHRHLEGTDAPKELLSQRKKEGQIGDLMTLIQIRRLKLK